MIPNLDIRPATMDDLASLIKINEDCFVAPWKKDNIIYELTENPVCTMLVATLNDVVIGFLDYWITFDSATICQIAISKQFRKMHIASDLMKDMLDDCYAKRVESITLEVREHNEAAINFYKKFGFEQTLVKKQYYTNGDNAIYMVKKVNI